MTHWIWYNGALVPRDVPCIAVAERGFRFGDGVFATLRVRGGVCVQWGWHQAQLAAGLKAIGMAYPVETLAEAAAALIAHNGQKEGLLRIYISRGQGSRGYLPALVSPPCVVMEVMDVPPPPAAPVVLWASSFAKIPRAALPVQYKLAQGMNPTLARMEATANGAWEALQCTIGGEVAEVSAANIFWQVGERIYTPSSALDLYAGSTRATLMERLPAGAVEEIAAPLSALQAAEAVVITNVSYGAVAVASLAPQGWHFPKSNQLAERFAALLQQS